MKIRIRFQKGFTLVEMLAVMVVLVVIGGIIAAILVSSLRGNNKTNSIHLVQENGNYALSQMTKMIHNARVLDSPYPCGSLVSPTQTNQIVLTNPDNTSTTLSCSNGIIASNGASLLDATNISLTSSCDTLFTCTQDSSSNLPVITIDFYLQKATTSNFVEQTASASAIEFKTSVDLRNIVR
ncbi:MAG: PilW family protein [Candidatus Levyibacteriota bacterium]